MSLTIVTTPAAKNANSYASVTETDAHFEGFTSSAWIKLGDGSETKKAALILATRQIDCLSFIGVKLNEGYPEGHDSYQALQWPRRANTLAESYFVSEDTQGLPYTYDSSGTLIVPIAIKQACMEQANYVVDNGTVTGELIERLRLQREGVRSFAVPGLSETYGGRPAELAKFSESCMILVWQWIVKNNVLRRG